MRHGAHLQVLALPTQTPSHVDVCQCSRKRSLLRRSPTAGSGMHDLEIGSVQFQSPRRKTRHTQLSPHASAAGCSVSRASQEKPSPAPVHRTGDCSSSCRDKPSFTPFRWFCRNNYITLMRSCASSPPSPIVRLRRTRRMLPPALGGLRFRVPPIPGHRCAQEYGKDHLVLQTGACTLPARQQNYTIPGLKLSNHARSENILQAS